MRKPPFTFWDGFSEALAIHSFAGGREIGWTKLEAEENCDREDRLEPLLRVQD
jgi:hypothetical protein